MMLGRTDFLLTFSSLPREFLWDVVFLLCTIIQRWVIFLLCLFEPKYLSFVVLWAGGRRLNRSVISIVRPSSFFTPTLEQGVTNECVGGYLLVRNMIVSIKHVAMSSQSLWFSNKHDMNDSKLVRSYEEVRVKPELIIMNYYRSW